LTKKEGLIHEIRSLYRTKLGRKKGVVMRSYKGMEVGIRTYNFEILAQDGIYSGYWTEPKPKLAERTIACRIVDTEDCQEWETLNEDELKNCIEFLQRYPQG